MFYEPYGIQATHMQDCTEPFSMFAANLPANKLGLIMITGVDFDDQLTY